MPNRCPGGHRGESRHGSRLATGRSRGRVSHCRKSSFVGRKGAPPAASELRRSQGGSACRKRASSVARELRLPQASSTCPSELCGVATELRRVPGDRTIAIGWPDPGDAPGGRRNSSGSGVIGARADRWRASCTYGHHREESRRPGRAARSRFARTTRTRGRNGLRRLPRTRDTPYRGIGTPIPTVERSVAIEPARASVEFAGDQL